MISDFECEGYWHLPDNPDNKLFGKLKFTSQEGGILDLKGSIRKKDMGTLDKSLELEIILGESTGGKYITLYECLEIGWQITGIQTSKFYIKRVFVGAHYPSAKDIKFKTLLIHYTQLEDWVNISGISQEPDKEGGLIKYKSPTPIQLASDTNYKIHIIFSFIPHFQNRPQKEVRVTQKTEIKIEFSEEQPFDEYLNIMYHIQNFFSLATLKPVYPLTLESSIKKPITFKGREIIEDSSVHIYQQFSNIIVELKPSIYPLFTLSDVKEIDNFLKKWIDKAELLKPVYDLYFGSLYRPQMYLQLRFLCLIQAIESYHRQRFENFETPEKEYEKKMTEILNSIPSDYRDWVNKKLKYSNEASLRNKLKDIIKYISDIIKQPARQRNYFINKVIITRNYLTHHDKQLEKQIARGKELYYLTTKLKKYLEIALLEEVGFTHETIKELISKNLIYEREIRNLGLQLV